ncbi:MAG TPA: TlpA disulfide reductase family protein [Gemmatimonadaceae bacterium]|nr:TlpA disulfide reductase family protein [Gemmatimonadaceae bacterium]
MTARQQWGVVLGVIVLLALGLYAGVRTMGDQLFPVTVGSDAPDFRARDLATHRIKSLADYKGQVVLLNVWATWCPPCKAEMPSIERLYRQYGPLGLRVVAVSIDDYVGEDSIRNFAKGLGLTFEILHDPTHAIEHAYQTTGYPETFVIGRDGTIRKKWIAAANWSSPANRALVAELLGVAPDARAGFEAGSGGDRSLPVHWDTAGAAR